MIPRVILATALGLLALGRVGANPAVAAKLQPFVDRQVISGAVTLIGTKDRVLGIEAVGSADLRAGRPMTPDTLFWIASMSKAFTGTALMMLVDEGKVKVDDRVDKYLPEFKDQMVLVEHDADHALLRRPSAPLTIRNLLTHTGGLTARTPLEQKIDLLSLRENVLTYPLLPLRFEPGSRYDYSNAGMNTAGRIVEVVSGLPFEVFLDQRIFGPLGMKDTTFWPDAGQLKRLAKSYGPAPGNRGLAEVAIEQLTYPLSDRRRGVCPAGGLFSTAHDVYLFCRMIANGGTYGGHRYISPAAIAQMTADQISPFSIGTDPAYGYGFGWIAHRGHSASDAMSPGSYGAGGAYNTQMGIDPARDLILVLMVQQAGFPESERALLRHAFTLAAEAAGRR